uniref:Uncharacterized protein n=1 Tax=Rhizophora mucronata TaxID=61149 RepID=A0A2P2NSM9_RHIMU
MFALSYPFLSPSKLSSSHSQFLKSLSSTFPYTSIFQSCSVTTTHTSLIIF